MILGSLPPPYSGYETANQALMACGLDAAFQLALVNTRTTRNPSARGRFSWANLWATGAVLLRVALALVRFRPHLVHIPFATNRTGYLKWLIQAIVARLAGARIVSVLGGSEMHRFYGRCGPLMRLLLRMGCALVRRMVVLGPSLKGQFRGLIADDRLMVVPTGFDWHAWRKDPPPRAPKSDARRIEVLFLGQVSKAKGVLDLLQAVKLLAQRGNADRFHFTIAGPIIEQELNILHIDNPISTSQALEEMLAALPVTASVELVGEVGWSDKRKLYRRADILLAPSYSEGFPYTLLEAFASECCVITTPVGAIGDTLSHDKEVLLVPVNDPEAIVEALLSLRDETRRARLNRVAMAYLQETHLLERHAHLMIDVYRRALR